MGTLIKRQKFLCMNCKKFFYERINKPYYTYEKFIDNQARLIFGEKQKYDMEKPINMVNCPHCYSNHAIKVIKDITNSLNTKAKHGGDRRSRTFTSINIIKNLKSKSLNTSNDK